MDQEVPLTRFLRTSEAAKFLRISPRSLDKRRCFGTGPAYYKLGGVVLYDPADLEAWVRRGRRTSTSDPYADIVPPVNAPGATTPDDGDRRRD